MAPSLLDLPISFFEYDFSRNTFANVPSHQTTLRRMVTTRYYQKPIEAIRAEPDKHKQDDMKKHLSAFTLALLNHRKKDTSFEEKIIYQWPLLMGDCDQKDNPGVDMAELKTHLRTLPYVLLCAYSVRGGLWFMVRLPDCQTPDTLAAHFRYLQKLFSEKFDIKLDSTKGGKPTDLRFVSYDANPYLNDEASVFSGTYTPLPPRRKQVPYNPNFKDDEGKLLARVVKMIDSAGEGGRHEALLKAARLAGGFIGANRLDEQNAILALETIASEWPQFTKSQKTIRDGIKYGQASPLFPERLPERPFERPVSRRQPAKRAEPIFYQYPEQIYSQPQRVEVEVKPEPPASEPKAEPRLIVKSIAGQLVNPGSVLRPDESQLERWGEAEVLDELPPEVADPSPPDAVPTLRVSTPTSGSYFAWQNSAESPFSKLGLASLPNKQQA